MIGFGPHLVNDTRDVKVYIIGWLRRGIKTFNEETQNFVNPQNRIDTEKFSAMLEEFVNILEEDWEEM